MIHDFGHKWLFRDKVRATESLQGERERITSDLTVSEVVVAFGDIASGIDEIFVESAHPIRGAIEPGWLISQDKGGEAEGAELNGVVVAGRHAR